VPKYIVLYKFTDQGRKNMRDILAGAEETQRHHEALGFKILGTYWTLGHYDFVAIVEAPSDEEMMAGMLNIAEAGNAVSESLRAFDSDEMTQVLASPNKGASSVRPQRLPRSNRQQPGG
jgi:uncharacterized protein with GYD domain